MNVYQLDDCDWWIGKTLQECIEDRENEYGPDEDFDKSFAHKVSDSQLENLTFFDDDDLQRSFKEQLRIEISKGGKFPRLFATTEF